MGNGRKASEIKRIRRSVFRRDGFMCVDCREHFYHPRHWRGENIPGLTLGHIIPAAMGGAYSVSNCVAQCVRDNKDLGARPWIPGWRDVYEVKGGTA